MTMQRHACLGRRSVRDLFPSYQFKKPLEKLLHLGVPSSTTHLNFSLHALCSIGHCNSRPPCIQSSRDGGLQSNPIPPPASRFLQILSFGQEPSCLRFLSTCKSVASIVTCQNWKRHVIKPASSYRQLWNCDQMRCLGCIAGVKVPSIHRPSDANKDLRIFRGSLQSGDAVQTRRFFGCGDGEEGGALSKVYEERRVLGYSPVQLFDVVAAVDLYQDFVPWCQRSEILKSYSDGSFDAELEIGFKFLVESYVSHVELKRPQHIKESCCLIKLVHHQYRVRAESIVLEQLPLHKYMHLDTSYIVQLPFTTVSQSTLFDHLINIWQFNSGPVPGSCNIYFLVDFKFQSPLYRQVASMFFREVVSRLVGSFSERCRLIYGPGIPIQEDAYGERV